MSDNTVLSPGSGGDTVRDIDRSGIKSQVVVLDIGGQSSEQLCAGFVTCHDQGEISQGTTNSGNPLQCGGVAITSLPTAVSNNQRVASIHDKLGRQVLVPFQVRGLTVQGNITLTSNSETTLLSAVSATFLDILGILVTNTSATGVRVDIRDSTGGTVRWQVWAPATDTRGMSFSLPLEQATVNNNWTAQLSAGVTDVRVFAIAVKNL